MKEHTYYLGWDITSKYYDGLYDARFLAWAWYVGHFTQIYWTDWTREGAIDKIKAEIRKSLHYSHREHCYI